METVVTYLLENWGINVLILLLILDKIWMLTPGEQKDFLFWLLEKTIPKSKTS